MTKRESLVWYESNLGRVPDCVVCLEHILHAPGLREAVASVAIEHPTTPDQLMRQVIDKYHANRHQEAR